MYQTWPLWRKHLVNFTVSLFVFLSNYITNSISPVLIPIATDFDITLTQASYLLTLNLLFLGLGNLFWVPLALKIGKRPVWVLCAIIFFASSVWSAVAKDFGSLLGARIVQGFGASAAEALGPTVVGDLFFLHERGLWMGLYVWVFSTGSGISGTFAGLIYNSRPDWHFVLWVNVILVGFLLVLVILFAAETNFIRPEDTEGGEGMDHTQLEEIRARGQTNWTASLSLFGWYDRLVHFKPRIQILEAMLNVQVGHSLFGGCGGARFSLYNIQQSCGDLSSTGPAWEHLFWRSLQTLLHSQYFMDSVHLLRGISISR